MNRLSFALALFLFAADIAHATEFSSADYQVLDPVIQPGGYSTSSGFQLTGVIAQIGIGTSTVATDDVRGGFLFFPFSTTPVVTATAGSAQVALTWTASDAFWAAVGHYDVGQATVSGGPYTFSNVGNVVTSTRTSLTNGTTYYFVVRVMDASDVSMATSSEVSATPISGGATQQAPQGAGSDGGIALSLLRLFAKPSLAPPRLPEIPEIARVADLNHDGRIGLKDLSIFLYTAVADPRSVDFNGNGAAGIGDLSLLFYGWTVQTFPPSSSVMVESAPDAFEGVFGSQGDFSERSQLAVVGKQEGGATEPEVQAPPQGLVSRAVSGIKRAFQFLLGIFIR